MDDDQLGHWETGRQPRPATLALLCEFYGGCSPADLGFDSAAAAAPSPSSALFVVGSDDPSTLRQEQ